MLGAVVSLMLNQVPGGVDWQIRWAIVLAPMLLYGLMMLGRTFPVSEAKESGISAMAMMGEVGLLGTAVVVALLGLWLSRDIVPSLLKAVNLPESLSWLGWALAAVLWIAFGALS